MKRLLLAFVTVFACINVYAWGSDVTYKDMPNSMSIVNPFPPEAIVVNPSGPSQDPNSYNKFTPTGRNNTGILQMVGMMFIYLGHHTH
ncbi:hypothetical protein [Aquella oligotrophica]|uniref:Uncharacterized protein n=1 Tax=Aquella oligotrophica TaxID=2067065 RepID=A0A2I7N5X6_9NEIS|nr:hypothetical protein [Aquella oligotrophica]AUR51877.1 hypothetical protein CUN60_06060 [Aquella oligotrophica]